MSNESRRRRREIVTRLREEGRQAALAGKNRQSNPHEYEDAYQWSNGFEEGQRELEAAESNE